MFEVCSHPDLWARLVDHSAPYVQTGTAASSANRQTDLTHGGSVWLIRFISADVVFSSQNDSKAFPSGRIWTRTPDPVCVCLTE